MKKTAKRSLIFVLALLITGVMTCSDSFAYFQRGSVGVYAGESLPHASVCQILQIVALRGEQLIAAAHQSHISSADEITLHIRGLLA